MHRPSTFALIPAFFLALACNSPAGGGTGTESGTDSSSSSSSSSSTTNNTNNTGGECVPGQSVACMCDAATKGAQTCDANGVFGPCECTGGTTTGNSSDPTTTGVTTVDTTTGDVTVSGTSTSTTGTTDVSTTGTTDVSSTGGSTSSTGGTTGGGDQPFGPCPNGDECLQGETCINGQSMMGTWTLCTPGECQDNADCDSDVCADAPGDGMFLTYCLPQTCDMQNPCPDGMQCYAGFGMGNASVCLWPN